MIEKSKKYLMLVFKGNESYDGNDIRLSFFSDNPFRGTLSDTIYGNNVNELKKTLLDALQGIIFMYFILPWMVKKLVQESLILILSKKKLDLMKVIYVPKNNFITINSL